MRRLLVKATALVATTIVLVGCATTGRELMPTPVLYRLPGGEPVFHLAKGARPSPDLDLLYITDRAPETSPESKLPYGQQRAKRIVFGSAQVRMVPPLDWATLSEESRLAKRTREIDLELGTVRQLGAFPEEPYTVVRAANGALLRDRAELARYDEAKHELQAEVERRLAVAPKKQVLLYVHGFNETFASAAYTTADLCHFLGREPVCAFFTWPASSSGSFLTSYTTTTESAEYAVEHLKKTIRTLAATPGVEGLQLLAHSRGSAVMLKAVHDLALEAIAAGKEPVNLYKIDNLVLLSPDIDVDIAAQQITGLISDPDLATVWPEARLPRILKGRLTVYASPEDRALRISQILFRSRTRVGQLRPEDMSPRAQKYLATLGRIDLISYHGARTDFFGHSYFTSNPQVSSDLIELIRYGKRLGEPGRQLIRTGPVTWRFPPAASNQTDRT
jgi:esterase/lipase superfamily enzyme